MFESDTDSPTISGIPGPLVEDSVYHQETYELLLQFLKEAEGGTVAVRSMYYIDAGNKGTPR